MYGPSDDFMVEGVDYYWDAEKETWVIIYEGGICEAIPNHIID